jgi:hypothetical protein
LRVGDKIGRRWLYAEIEQYRNPDGGIAIEIVAEKQIRRSPVVDFECQKQGMIRKGGRDPPENTSARIQDILFIRDRRLRCWSRPSSFVQSRGENQAAIQRAGPYSRFEDHLKKLIETIESTTCKACFDMAKKLEVE